MWLNCEPLKESFIQVTFKFYVNLLCLNCGICVDDRLRKRKSVVDVSLTYIFVDRFRRKKNQFNYYAKRSRDMAQKNEPFFLLPM